ncbi:Nif3-like dinuclear metal center hexameric protein [Bacillus infantis]|uniref:Nif3-like dinuclear metal center hexameric protein n=1 Tax=Bacillus infantis TaxID=324767 RepID=UPI00209EF6C0|nr:Nif3-like dinuclear metal center hexameric protein [Bacillus infantis]
MDLDQFSLLLEEWFGKELLEEFSDDYGFTHITEKKIRTVGYAVNLSPETIEQAVSSQVDLMITHHDAWDFIFGMGEECRKELQKHQISHFWIHGPLDYASFGTCTSLMEKIGIDEIIQYSIFNNQGIPGIGEFKEPLSFDRLANRLSCLLDEPVRSWRNNGKEVKRVGIMTGAGHSTDYLKLALDGGCDTYITGEASLYTIQYAQFAGLNLLVGSHTFTEIFGVETFAGKVKLSFPEVKILKLKESHFELNPAT